jgi:transcriptional regulator with XRE-family HTH domain
MTSKSRIRPLSPEENADYGHARVKDQAFDVIRLLWARRQAEGMKQADLAAKTGKDQGWISRNLRGPGNWTFRTYGAFLAGLNAEVEMVGHLLEDRHSSSGENYHVYADFAHEPARSNSTVIVKQEKLPESASSSVCNPKVEFDLLGTA